MAAEHPKIITSDTFCMALIRAGVIRDGERFNRLVIDAQAGHAVRIYAERLGDERLLDVAVTLDGVQVTIAGQPVPEEAA